MQELKLLSDSLENPNTSATRRAQIKRNVPLYQPGTAGQQQSRARHDSATSCKISPDVRTRNPFSLSLSLTSQKYIRGKVTSRAADISCTAACGGIFHRRPLYKQDALSLPPSPLAERTICIGHTAATRARYTRG